MKTDVYKLRQFEKDYKDIPEAAEKAAAFNGLDERSSLRLRLLAEELICMLPQLLIYGSGSFWIESTGRKYELHLTVTPNIGSDYDIDKIISVSSSGSNAAAKGIVGRIVTAVEAMLNSRAKLAKDDPYGDMPRGVAGIENEMVWSLNTYRDSFSSHSRRAEEAEEWDELEKSIIANIADDVTVGVKSGKVSIVITKDF